MRHYVQDKVVIITGGSSGFGLEAARILLEMDARVVITGRSEQRLNGAAEDLRSDRVLAVRADAVQVGDWHRLIQATLDRFGRVDVLVNNHGAGIKIAELEQMQDSDIRTILDVNLTSVIMGCRETIKVMKRQGSGHIVNVSSGCAHYSWARWATYSAAKAGLISFTRCLHKEMAEWGGKATSFVPGAARTGFCEAAGIAADWMSGYPNAHDFARTLVHCIDVPDNCVIDEVVIWGTKQVKDALNPY
ncbi:MAG: SDR family oxidoreductase [Thermoguttaceae bacterium]|jgi:NAD(P)-dependent dehydrogenase (short-subunit alcohol dehydrogenase family)|nr:SDR family oxidoreductase [Thermoguttaceae bacterium]